MIPAPRGQYLDRSAGSWTPPVNSFFIIFADRLDAPGPPTAYRDDDGKVVIFDTSPEAELALAELTAINKHPNTSFTVTEFQPV